MGLILCGIAFILVLFAGWRSKVAGVGMLLLVGYLFGIVRANYPDTYSHFIFDCATLGLYLGFFGTYWEQPRNQGEASLRQWVWLLLAWIGIMFLIPVQHPLIQLVGLRGNAYLLPCVLIGSQISDREGRELALWLACLNLLALAFGVAEFTMGIERFFPENPMTELIYRSRDIAGFTAFRIPACFSNAHSYAGTMVLTFAWLAGVWMQPNISTVRRWLLLAGMAAAVLGVLLAGARLPLVELVVLLIVVTFSGKISPALWAAWALMLGGIGYLVSGEERLQRFLSLQDTEGVLVRIEGSVNMGFFELLTTYPMGNGLGGGGTSIPFFLHYLIRNPVGMENEYSRILLEQGVVGLVLWASFMVWSLTRSAPSPKHPWSFGCRLLWITCLITFGASAIGTGLMTSIPQTSLVFFSLGFLCVPRSVLVRKKPRPVEWSEASANRTNAEKEVVAEASTASGVNV